MLLLFRLWASFLVLEFLTFLSRYLCMGVCIGFVLDKDCIPCSSRLWFFVVVVQGEFGMRIAVFIVARLLV